MALNQEAGDIDIFVKTTDFRPNGESTAKFSTVHRELAYNLKMRNKIYKY